MQISFRILDSNFNMNCQFYLYYIRYFILLFVFGGGGGVVLLEYINWIGHDSQEIRTTGPHYTGINRSVTVLKHF